MPQCGRKPRNVKDNNFQSREHRICKSPDAERNMFTKVRSRKQRRDHDAEPEAPAQREAATQGTARSCVTKSRASFQNFVCTPTGSDELSTRNLRNQILCRHVFRKMLGNVTDHCRPRAHAERAATPNEPPALQVAESRQRADDPRVFRKISESMTGDCHPASLCKAGGEAERAARFVILLEAARMQISALIFEKISESMAVHCPPRACAKRTARPNELPAL